MMRWVFRLLVLVLATGLAAVILAGLAYQKWVVQNPGEHISRGAIQSIVAQESAVLYRDGETAIGAFFDEDHRIYVPYEEIPQDWVNAIVAAEDQRFFEHPGVDPIGLTRAMWQNVRAGRLVSGGSSLTQQTAENLYYTPGRSVARQLKEMVNALRLEHHHSKSDILEFYANQFHVSSNGRGIGIAARYFFDKEVTDLSLLESAFLAGMVKGPANYNPFLGSQQRRQKALKRAHDRTGYVLDRMLEMGTLSEAEHANLSDATLPFKEGTFRYGSNVLLDEVARRLDEAPFPKVFADLGIDNPSTAGLSIVSAVDPVVQRESTYGLWHHLTEVGGVLEQVPIPATGEQNQWDPDGAPEVHEFAWAKVAGGDRLDFGANQCVLDQQAFARAAAIRVQGQKAQPWRTPAKSEVQAMRQALVAGSVVWASRRDEQHCDLEVRPELQGGVLVLEQGQIRAMVGGNNNQGFNRAIAAKRQLGSTWKPLLFYAALRLGWSPTDVLDNRRAAFHFEGTWYTPRPDHQSEDFVSMAWAATRSENLASIWLLQNLTEPLDDRQLKQVADWVGLLPQGDRKETIALIRDEFGVISSLSRLDEVAYYTARREIMPDLAAEERMDLLALFYKAGRGTNASKNTAHLFDANYLRVQQEAQTCATRVGTLSAALRQAQPTIEGLHLLSRDGRLVVGCGDAPEGAVPFDGPVVAALQTGLVLPISLEPDDAWVDGRWRVGTIDRITRSMARRKLVLVAADLYDWEVLRDHPDFRVLLNMRIMAKLARQSGVKGELPPVMSMPLGAVDISLEEAALMYSRMVEGATWTFPGVRSRPGKVAGFRDTEAVPEVPGDTLLIAEIRDRRGNVLYRADPQQAPIEDEGAGILVGHMLQNVVQWGTGRWARQAVITNGEPVMIGGKTGTTNAYKNAAFSGFVPTRSGSATITAYVGYDDNRTMRRGGFKIQGANGALPPWVGAANGMVAAGMVTESLDWTGLDSIKVDRSSGLPTSEGEAAVLISGERRLSLGAKPSVVAALQQGFHLQDPEPSGDLLEHLHPDDVLADEVIVPEDGHWVEVPDVLPDP